MQDNDNSPVDVRVVRGNADEAELAALIAVLWAGAKPEPPPVRRKPPRRPRWTDAGFQPPGAWSPAPPRLP